MKQIKVMFVCMGNICRSPAGEGILRHMAKDLQALNIQVASSGIGDWHVGNSPDSRMRQAAAQRGIHLEGKAQQFQKAFFYEYDYILAADKEVFRDLHVYAKTDEEKAKIYPMTAFSKRYPSQDVPDPYYGGASGFDRVMDILEDACQGLVEHIHEDSKEK